MTSLTDPVVAPADAALRLAYGLDFADLYARDGLARLDAAFVARLAEADVTLHDRLVTARATPDALAAKDESELLIALAPHLEDVVAELFGIGADMRALQARHDALAPLYTVKRLFVQRRAAKKYGAAAAAAFDGDALRRALEEILGGPFDEMRFAAFVAPALRERGRARRGSGSRGPLCRLGDPHGRRPAPPPRRRAVQGPRQDRPDAARSGRDRGGRRRHHVQAAGPSPALPRRLRPHRLRHRSDRRARSGQLLHLVPQPGQGQLRPRPQGEDRQLPPQRVRRGAGRLPAGGAHLRDESRQGGRPHGRRPGDRHDRQSDVRGDRPPHLQRLHEVVHLSEAGPGRHPADRDPHPQGRAGSALGLRDLLAADPLESAEPAPSPAPPRLRPHRAGGRPGAGRLHARASSDERRPRRRRGRRLEGRAAGARAVRCRHDRRPRAVPADPRRRRAGGESRHPRDGRLRRRRRVRHHGAVEQELPQADPAAAGAARSVQDVRRRALRRHARARGGVPARLRSRRAVHRRRQADRSADEERPRHRRAPGLRTS